MNRVFRAVALLLLASSPALAQQGANDPPPIRREFRGAWVASVANIDWPSRPGLSSWQQQAELRAILDRAVQLNLNAVLLQVRPAADALYDSPYEPWSSYLTGVEGRPPEPYFDALKFAVAEAHARGLELHAWFNPYRARHPSAKGEHARTHVSVAHPELVRHYGQYEWMDPGEPAVISRTLRAMLDVVKRYDVDGIHIDDYFYPYPELGPDSTVVPFPDSSSYARYTRAGGRLDRDDWRRHNVDTLIQQIYLRTKAIKPWVKVGISPFGIWRPGNPPSIKGFDSYEKLYGDSRRWLREGWVDYFTPQLYWPIAQTSQSYTTLLDWWIGENVKGRHIWPGHNASRAAAGGAWSPDELNAQIRATRATAATGDVFFSMRTLMPPGTVHRDSSLVGVATQPPREIAAAALTDHLFTELYSSPALIPPSPWLSSRRPARPVASVSVDSVTGDRTLHLSPAPASRVAWWTVRVRTGDDWRSWILPGAQDRLVVAGAAETRPLRVVVTAVDRFGTESARRDLSVGAPALRR
ncbi:MAG: glycoside hydrolase family 10 protein [Gemmatimonadales bacterium]